MRYSVVALVTALVLAGCGAGPTNTAKPSDSRSPGESATSAESSATKSPPPDLSTDKGACSSLVLRKKPRETIMDLTDKYMYEVYVGSGAEKRDQIITRLQPVVDANSGPVGDLAGKVQNHVFSDFTNPRQRRLLRRLSITCERHGIDLGKPTYTLASDG